MMTNLTDADLAAMKARADAAQDLTTDEGKRARSGLMMSARKDVSALLSEVAALRQQLDLAATTIRDLEHADDCPIWEWDEDFWDDHLDACDCWKSYYDAAKEALDHE